MMARMLMSDNLCICSPATLGLQALWADYEDMLLVDLPEKYENLSIEEFIERQETRMNQVHKLLASEWIQSAISIIQEETKQIIREQVPTFFEATSTLMSNQLRQLITDSVKAYVAFI